MRLSPLPRKNFKKYSCVKRRMGAEAKNVNNLLFNQKINEEKLAERKAGFAQGFHAGILAACKAIRSLRDQNPNSVYLLESQVWFYLGRIEGERRILEGVQTNTCFSDLVSEAKHRAQAACLSSADATQISKELARSEEEAWLLRFELTSLSRDEMSKEEFEAVWLSFTKKFPEEPNGRPN